MFPAVEQLPTTPRGGHAKRRHSSNVHHLSPLAGAVARITHASSPRSRASLASVPTSPIKHKRRSGGDRFIPDRSQFDNHLAFFRLTDGHSSNNGQRTPAPSPAAAANANANANGTSPIALDSATSPKVEAYKRHLAHALLNDGTRGGGRGGGGQILRFSSPPRSSLPASPTTPASDPLRAVYARNRASLAMQSVSSGGQNAGEGGGRGGGGRRGRVIPHQPERVLDAPDFVDDYYLNLLSWGANNVLAVALDNALYLWNGDTGTVSCLAQLEDDVVVTSVSWARSSGGRGEEAVGSGASSLLAIGLSNAQVQVWDVAQERRVRVLGGHSARVSALDWSDRTLSSGSRDTSIVNHDVRAAEHQVLRYRGHRQEVCGLKWSRDGSQLASGGNDNLVQLWDPRGDVATHVLREHSAAVKAIAWCPWDSHLLATGGGSADRTIRFWNTINGACLNSVDTYSQVCALEWSRFEKEIVSAHGFSQNQLSVWKYPSMAKLADLTGHTARVLAMAQSPDGRTVVSVSGDESLRFWKCLGPNTAKHSKRGGGSTGRGLVGASLPGPASSPGGVELGGGLSPAVLR